MLKLLVPFVLLIALVGATVLFDRPMPRADFRFINRGDVTTLDLAQMSWMQDLRVARLLWEGLTKNDVFTLNYDIAPGVAERWEPSPDGKTYTFHLRENAKWSNGSPVTAEDFVFSWRRCLLPDIAADYVKLFTLIKGGQAFYDWRTAQIAAFTSATSGPFDKRSGVTQADWDALRANLGEAGWLVDRAREKDANVIPTRRELAQMLWQGTIEHFERTVAVRAEGPRTLVVELERPTPYFLDLTSFAVFYPVYPPIVKAHESVDEETGRLKTNPDWTKPPTLVTNGPFVLTAWRFKRDMRLERNEFYWKKSEIMIRSISIPSVDDPNSQVLAFQTGAVDWVSDVTPQYVGDILDEKQAFYREHQAEVDRLRAEGWDSVEIDRRLPPDPRNRISTFPAFGTYWYNFNCLPRLADGRENPFHDARVRRAFAMAIDKREIVENVRRRGEPVATTIIPPGSIGGYDSPRGVPFDPAAARALLAEAGYPDPSTFITVEILFNKDGGHDLIAQTIARQWEKHLGVRVALAQKEIKVFRDDLKKQNFMVSRAGWFGDYGDPTTFLDLSRKDDGNNDRKYHSPRYEALLDQALDEVDPQKRMDLLEEAERILVDEDLPMIPLFHYVQIYAFDPHRITGVSSHPRQEQNLYWVDVFGDGIGTDAPRVMERRPSTR